jgi:hypothetical protein
VEVVGMEAADILREFAGQLQVHVLYVAAEGDNRRENYS